ncbi:F-box/LRR-repeat protein At4g14103-like [Papaver somniferum]|uniref:F-box/LRR-repeat protein At4g14103-like n=1 Tax=Papaver somniferum TaxID=3469 RepID=UPI000E705584|nr:F-box/LRR-repeat protein At4g14103-like [Papaver somniferum]
MEESKDRISNLPDDIIDHILFFLDMKYVVQTSLLSRGWKYTWTSVSTLDFDTREFMSSETKQVFPFVRFLNMVLMYRGLSNLEEFRLYWDNKSNEIATYLNHWIIGALIRKVQRLVIEIEYNENLTFRLPRLLFNSSSLVKLILDISGRVVLPDSMGLPQLKHLTLCNFIIDDVKLVNKLLSSCPVLRSLLLRDIEANTADGVWVIEFSELKHLEINNYGTARNIAKVIKLSTPRLKSFTCSDYTTQEYSLGNLSSLVTASVDMKTIEDDEEELYPERMMGFLVALHNVEKLTLLSDFFQVLSRAPNVIRSPLQFHNLRYLKLDMCFTRNCLHTLTCLLRISHNVETIFLTLKEWNVAEDGEVGLLPCGLSHLKYIEIRGLTACDNELKFLELVLKEAVVLEEMDLYFSNPEDLPDATESPDRLELVKKRSELVKKRSELNKKFARKLRALPRVSSCSMMLVC